jgi:hypothetical protein
MSILLTVFLSEVPLLVRNQSFVNLYRVVKEQIMEASKHITDFEASDIGSE